MKLYWTFLAISIAVWIWYSFYYRVVIINGKQEKRAWGIQSFLFFGILVFFCGLRSGIADTGAYIHMFNSWPNSISNLQLDSVDIDKGFYIISVLYKQFISTDFHGWLFLFSAISGIALIHAFRKYSEEFGMSCFLFIATTMFVYLVNGMRQFLVVTIVLAFSDWIYERKYIQFICLVLVLSTLHASVLIFIPLCFVVNAKAWSTKMYLTIVVALGCAMFWNQIMPSIGSALESTQYSEYADILATEGAGSSIFRLLIALVPVVLTFMGRRIIEQEINPFINLAINMSVINACLYIIASISSGMAVGRLTVYFDIYNIILLPWVLKHIFTERSGQLVKLVCAVSYIVFFYIQMVVTWNLPYESDILKMFF